MPFFNGVKVFHGGHPGATQAEVRVDGARRSCSPPAGGQTSPPTHGQAGQPLSGVFLPYTHHGAGRGRRGGTHLPGGQPGQDKWRSGFLG